MPTIDAHPDVNIRSRANRLDVMDMREEDVLCRCASYKPADAAERATASTSRRRAIDSPGKGRFSSSLNGDVFFTKHPCSFNIP